MIQLTPNLGGDFYDVKIGLISRNTYFKDKGKEGKEKRPLLERPKSGFNTDNIGERRSPLQEEAPRAISGQSDNSKYHFQMILSNKTSRNPYTIRQENY
ncbi:MAG: hypothetical protein K5930_11315 [Treponemataceae bacterium]|nr:hypothetical protein [Treponemataceae bacterium]